MNLYTIEVRLFKLATFGSECFVTHIGSFYHYHTILDMIAKWLSKNQDTTCELDGYDYTIIDMHISKSQHEGYINLVLSYSRSEPLVGDYILRTITTTPYTYTYLSHITGAIKITTGLLEFTHLTKLN